MTSVQDSSPFAVEVEDTMLGRWRVSITQNGYQWQTISVAVRDYARAKRIRDFLAHELAHDAQLDWDEVSRMSRDAS